MYKKNSILLILIIIVILMAGCTSSFDKSQREKQQIITLSVSNKISSNITSLINLLLQSLQEPADINSMNFQSLSTRYPEISALFLYNDDLELMGNFPHNMNDDDIIENCLTNNKRKNISSINKPIIGHSLHINSDVFVCITIPLFITGQEKQNLVVALINTEIFFSRIEQEYVYPYPYSLIVINSEQDVVYDSDPIRIGKDFLTKTDSDDYDLALGNIYNMMTENKTDYFITNIEEQKRKLRKIYTWQTIDLYNPTFYVTLVRNLNRSTSKQSEDVYLLSTLRSYSIQDTLIDPIIENRIDEVQRLLHVIYDNNSHVYSIQLADTSGTVITGWPPFNSIIGYCNKQNLNKPFDNALEQVIQMKEENIIHSALLEGGEGKITFIPVLVHEDIYGVLIAIEPKGN